MNNIDINATIKIDGDVNTRVKNCGKLILDCLGKDNLEISVLICNDEKIKTLNKAYRNIDAATDVLSFPQEDNFRDHDKNYAGDVVLSLETAKRQASETGEPLGHVVKHLLIHGFLHLIGFDHIKDTDYHRMRTQEEEILSELEGVRVF